jgi:hypothetical protein
VHNGTRCTTVRTVFIAQSLQMQITNDVSDTRIHTVTLDTVLFSCYQNVIVWGVRVL